jgi:superfamily II DNA or RNA helicase
MNTNNNNYKTYLGQKGYTILKNQISIEQQIKIKNDLTVKPYVGGTIGAANNAVTFPAYRESDKKLYVPHYYGVENFGPPKEYNLSNGVDINLEFSGNLRDYQEPVVKKYLDYVTNNGLGRGAGGGLLELPCAFGKTSLSLYMISQLKKKTLVIVHKEFLLNQWIERIQQFLPKARIGRIQGQIIDIEDKDIVIGMLQSLSMKEYPQSVFESFGFTIIDEVHHISSQTFSNALFKIVTKYMLGLSATMNRKDGTTRVFKMFLGDVIYKGKRDEERNVIVRGIEYHVDDDDFNNVITDFRGNVAYSSMISKLCEYSRRSEFILKILVDLLKEDNKQQIIVLAHNKNLLKYLHDAIKTRNISTVGYYVGGMKEQALKESESKQVIIATYSMAAEGLDIKTLTTLIMATPKTDIQQSVGRILREKHSQPIVVDIIDSHEPFKNQWKKRRAFYMKEKYKIVYTTSDKYKNSNENHDEWTTVFDINTSCKTIKKSKIKAKTKSKSKKTNNSRSTTDRSITNDSDIDSDSDSDSEHDGEFEKNVSPRVEVINNEVFLFSELREIFVTSSIEQTLISRPSPLSLFLKFLII